MPSNLRVEFIRIVRTFARPRSLFFAWAGEIMNFVFLFLLDKLHTGDWRGTASIAIEASIEAKDTIAAIFDSLYIIIAN